MIPRIVIDTNVFFSGLRSQHGASYRLLELIGTGKFEIVVSVPLVLEYEEISKRRSRALGMKHSDLDDILDYICAVGDRREIFYLWRPFLKDAEDDMVLELAVESNSSHIITHNIVDFAGAEMFGIKATTPADFLKEIGELK
jgi:putative PIN family toxin of toxin-antitoxin system